MANEVRTSYDEVPYESFPFPQTHPQRLATLGHLFGLAAPRLDDCRVLELGCAAGGNLIPMALALPQAQFVGVDLSAVQVAQGQAVIDALGLGNIRLLAMSITDVDASFGRFDYVLSHGVYSWVPNAVQEAMLAICAAQLTDQGIAYISYNTLPGWRMRGMIRDLMRYHAMPFADPAQRVAQARAILDFLARSVPAGNDAYGLLLQSELEGLRRAADYYILHEHLEDLNEPLYFHEFAERAGRHGLQYLGEADFSTMLASNFPREVNDTVLRIAPDVIRQEQYMDFLRNRMFRQTLLVRDGVAVDRSVTPQRLRSLWVSGALRPAGAAPDLRTAREDAYLSPAGGTLRTPNTITKAAIEVLHQHWPQAMGFDELLSASRDLRRKAAPGLSTDVAEAADTLASDILQCYAAGLLQLHVTPSGFVVTPGPRPLACPLARWQAAQGLIKLTTRRHDTVDVDANLGRLLPLLDGTRDRDALCRIVAGWGTGANGAAAMNHPKLAATVRQRVDQALVQLARSALLLA